jgi:predicted RNA-binding Zn-ribbon protein involved in translation (DUF1610 family)
MKRSTYAIVCFGFFLLVIGGVFLLGAISNLNYASYIQEQINEGSSWYDQSDIDNVLSYFYFCLGISASTIFVGFLLSFMSIRSDRRWTRVVAIASAHEQLTLEEISKQANLPLAKTRSILYSAIASKAVVGSLKDDVFYRAGRYIEPRQAAVEKTVLEREVMVTRKVPETCFKCGASIKPDEVSWLGPDNVECPHCGASLKVITERV